MTWVYCEPKSRMTIRDAGATALVADTGILANGRVSAVVGLVKGALAGDAALKFLRGSRLRGVGHDVGLATAQEDARSREHDGGKENFHARCK